MAELVLPGVFIEVRPEALIVPGPISIGNIGIVGTARSGPVGEVKVIGSYAEAREVFGSYDAFDNPDVAGQPLTLVRALQLAYDNGASTVYAVRVTGTDPSDPNDKDNNIAAWGKNTEARKAFFNVQNAANATVAVLKANYHGIAGNKIKISVVDATDVSGNVIVTLKSGAVEESYTVKDGAELVSQINADRTGSAIVTGSGGVANQKPKVLPETSLDGGLNGSNAAPTDYEFGLEQLVNEDAHIIVAAGLDDTNVAGILKAHVEKASTDKNKHDRIAVVGSRPGATFDQIRNHSVSSERMIFVAPGIKTNDSETEKEDKAVTLSGGYAAAAIAGMLSGLSPHVSLTNKTLAVGGLETKFTPDKLGELVKKNVLALEARKGFRVVKGITTAEGAFNQITTRRIVDFAKFGVRSASEPYIGLLNNDRVRKALKGSINGFLAGMVDDEMLVSYELDVTATRDEEIRGIAKVTMTLRPTFSIDYIKVVMFLG